ncbi:MAG: hypothetical protein ACM34K_17135 [Bacillota bacterium]
MEITIVKKVKVEVTDKDINKFRSDYQELTSKGICSKDSFIAFMLAQDKAVEKIVRQDNSVETITSLDNELPAGINKF